MNEALAREILETGLDPYARRLNAGLLDGLLAEFLAWPGDAVASQGPERAQTADGWAAFLSHTVTRRLEGLYALRKRHAAFLQHHEQAATGDERRQLVLDYARDLGADAKRLAGDARALDRWFGADAMVDRYAHHHTASERRMACALQRLGAVAALRLREAADPRERETLWRRLGLEGALRPLLAYDGDSRVCLEAFRTLVVALESMPAGFQEHGIADTTLQFVYRSAIDTRQQVWIQCEAIRLLRSLSPDSFEKVARIRLEKPGTGDDLFVRRRTVIYAGEEASRRPGLAGLLTIAARDPSPFVRQAVPRALAGVPVAPLRSLLTGLAENDPSPQVRAAAVLEILPLLRRADLGPELSALLTRVLRSDTDPLVLRAAAHVAAEGARALAGSGHALLPEWIRVAREELSRLHVRAPSLAARRWAAQAQERIWCETDPAAGPLRLALEEPVRTMSPGCSYRLPGGLLRGRDEAVIGRVLSVLAQKDFGIDLERAWWGDLVTRGHVFRFRLWRLLHELRNPSPDKREGFPHTVGRIFHGRVRAPSAILSELTETKVPGEPLYMPAEDGWRPYLPLVDEALSSLPLGPSARALRLYTSEGVTEIAPPRWWILRLIARIRLTLGFARYARLRNWVEGEQAPPDGWTRALTRMGFRLRFRAYDDGQGGTLPEDPAVRRFFPPPEPAAGG